MSIAGRAPDWYTGREYKALAPKVWFFRKYKRDGDWDFYVKQYRKEVLDRLNPEEVFRRLGNDAILLCWEPAGEPCHRRLAAEWLEGNLGIKVPEIPECAVGLEEVRERFNFLKMLWDARDVKLEFGISQGINTPIQVILGRIEVKERGLGVGTVAMTEVARLADQLGVDMYLVPSDSYGSNVDGLKRFYRRFGFKFYGSYKDEMVRTFRG